MDKKPELRVHVEFGGMTAHFEGDADEVLKGFTRFLTQVYPSLEIARRLVYAPDIIAIAEDLSGLVELSSEGPIIVSKGDLSARELICLALLGTHVGYRLGKLSTQDLSPDELARVVGKAKKTVMNELPGLVSNGQIEKGAEGKYSITVLGIKRAEEIIEDYKAKVEIKGQL